MKAIMTKFHGPTNHKGERISASDGDGNRVMLSWDYGLSTECNHIAAAMALLKKMDWRGSLVHGWFKYQMVFVFNAYDNNCFTERGKKYYV